MTEVVEEHNHVISPDIAPENLKINPQKFPYNEFNYYCIIKNKEIGKIWNAKGILPSTSGNPKRYMIVYHPENLPVFI